MAAHARDYQWVNGNSRIDFWVSGETTSDPVMGPAYFNSRFDMDDVSAGQNARLTICLRVCLAEVGPWTKTVTDRDGRPFLQWPQVLDYWTNSWKPLAHWPDKVFDLFRTWVEQQATSFWGNKDSSWGNSGFWLFCTRPDWQGLDWPRGGNRPTHRLYVNCDFECIRAAGDGDAHVLIHCAYLNPKVPPPPAPACAPVGSPPSNGPKICAFVNPGRASRTGTGLLTFETIAPRDVPCLPNIKLTRPITGYCVPHEIGHAIGLPHIGVLERRPDCLMRVEKGDNGSCLECMTGGTEADANNIMGYGHKTTLINALPWAVRAAEHTHTNPSDWMIGLGQRAPLDLNHLRQFTGNPQAPAARMREYRESNK